MAFKMTVENALQAKEAIERMELQGYSRDSIYIFAHDRDRESDITEALDVAGTDSRAVLESLQNVVKKRGDELRSAMVAAGLTEKEAAEYEKELDKGKLVLISNKEQAQQ